MREIIELEMKLVENLKKVKEKNKEVELVLKEKKVYMPKDKIL